MNSGIFITFEGCDGSGKSTQCRLLYHYLQSLGHKVLLTREIGGTPEAEKIRYLVVHNELLEMSELLLVMAARFEHVNRVLIPKLNEGYIIICDRFVDSTAAYQGHASNIGINKVYEMHNAIIGLMPNITFFMDVNPNIAINRTCERVDNNKFEDKELIFHQKVYENFLVICNKFPDRIAIIPAKEQNIDQIHYQIKTLLGNVYSE